MAEDNNRRRKSQPAQENNTVEETVVEEVTFLSKARDGAIWDDKRNRTLCKFEDYRFTTSNTYIIQKLRDLGYEEV